MRRLMFRFISIFVLCLFVKIGFAQSTLLPISNTNPNHSLFRLKDESVHTAMQPIVMQGARVDSLTIREFPVTAWHDKNWIFRKIFTEHLVEVKTDEFEVNIDRKSVV